MDPSNVLASLAQLEKCHRRHDDVMEGLLAAARRLRNHEADADRSARGALVEIHDLVSTAIIVSLRRAHDLADAITARGGLGSVSDGRESSFAWRDAITLLGVTAVVAALLVFALR